MNRAEIGLDIPFMDESTMSSGLLRVEKGFESWKGLNQKIDIGEIYLNSEAKAIFDGLKKPRKTEIYSLRCISVDKLVSGRSDEVRLEEITANAKKRGLEAVKPEVAFYLSLKELEERRFLNPVYLLSKVNRRYRVFALERDGGSDLSLTLYPLERVSRGLKESKFDKDEEFVFGVGRGRRDNSRIDLTNL